MRVVKRINHNAALCLDSKGREVVALGKGIGFPNIDELDLARVERTFYGVDARYLALLEDIQPEVLSFSAQITDVIRNLLPYEISDTFALVLADHIAFMLKRAHEHVHVAMPLSYDIAQFYPLEWQLSAFIVERVEKSFAVDLEQSEVIGVAMTLLNAAGQTSASSERDNTAERLLTQATRTIERRLDITINKASMNYARFATHMHYMVCGTRLGDMPEEQGEQMLQQLFSNAPEIVLCARELGAQVERETAEHLSPNELVYLAIHINRLYGAAKGE